MPSIKIIGNRSIHFWSKTLFVLLCSSLIACGGSSGTTRVSNDITIEPKPPVITYLGLTVRIPMHIRHAKLEVFVIGKDQPIYSKADFEGFEVSITSLTREDHDKIIHVKLSGDDRTEMFDPILNRHVKFQGEINAIHTISDKLVINLTPMSEAIYQRSLIRSGNLDLTQPNLNLIQAKHIKKSTSEVNSSLSHAFNTPNLPEIGNVLSISLFNYDKASPKNFINTFTGLGLLKLWLDKYPDSNNTYLDLATHLAVDLRDGYLDGRTIVGDKTPFLPLVDAPKNTNPELNNLLDIGLTQQHIRESFGEALKTNTLAYARHLATQNITYAEGIKALESHQYYTTRNNNNSIHVFRWDGAGDYRPAIGINTSATCQGISVLPCKQGLNADDTETNYSDIEYLIGTHQVGNCTIKMRANGDVELYQNDRIIRSQINRDITDNLLQLDRTTHHYILNIGTSEISPSYFIQIELKEGQIITAKSGSSNEFYPISLSTTDIRCT